MRFHWSALWAIGLAFTGMASIVAADASRGPDLFKPCAACHAVGEGAVVKFGPPLNGVFDRPAGSVEGYAYSDAFKAATSDGEAWTRDALGAYLEAPMSVMPGTMMAYPGVKDATDRADLMDWLALIDAQGTLPDVSTDEAPDALATEVQEPRIPAKDVPIPEHGVLHLGRVALPEEIAAWDIDVRPDGTGLPAGEGDAITGGELYDAQCAVCHGVFGEGEGRWPILAGGADSLAEDRPEKTIGSYWPYLSTVFDYVRRAMPYGNARSLSDDDVYAITAYLLYLNDLVDEDFVLSNDNFGEIALPNQDGFYIDDRYEVEPHFSGMEEPCMSDCLPGLAEVTMRAQVLDVTPDAEAEGVGVD